MDEDNNILSDKELGKVNGGLKPSTIRHTIQKPEEHGFSQKNDNPHDQKTAVEMDIAPPTIIP